MYKPENLLDFMKGKLTMNYLYTNAYLKKEKKNYPIGFALLNFVTAILAANLPIFLVSEEFDIPMGTFGGMNLTENQNVLILWTVLGVLLVIHVWAYYFQHHNKLFWMGRINLPTIVGILWLFLFQERLRYWASALCVLTGILYLFFYFNWKKTK